MPVHHTQLLALGSEREALAMNLDAQREGLIRKIEGVADAMARQAPTASSLSLLGLVKHAVTWERRWFEVIMAGRELPDGWPDRPSPHEGTNGHGADPDGVVPWLQTARWWRLPWDTGEQQHGCWSSQ